MIRVLVENGAGVNAVDADGDTALDAAAAHGFCAAAALLVRLGATVDSRDNNGWTPLMTGAAHGHCEMVRLLLSRGANMDLRDNNGNDAADLTNEELDAKALADLDPDEYELLHAARPKEGMAKSAALLADVRRAGGWKAYVREPRARLLALRHFCQEGRAAPPAGGVLERLFFFRTARVDGGRRTRAARRAARFGRTTLPKEVFWHVVRFWRCDTCRARESPF